LNYKTVIGVLYHTLLGRWSITISDSNSPPAIHSQQLIHGPVV